MKTAVGAGVTTAKPNRAARAGKQGGVAGKILYGARIVPAYVWQSLRRRSSQSKVHLIMALADHFEPAIVPGDGWARAPYDEQERRLEEWCREYPKVIDRWRDHDERPLVHTYFYPAEQYDRGLISRIADHCHAGWGEIEIHLHHGLEAPDTSENLRRVLSGFRDKLAFEHGCLAQAEPGTGPKYAFVHGNFALANSAGGVNCGVDEEMQVLGETGCFADMTLPASPFHPAQPSKINSLYECDLELSERAACRSGTDLARGRAPRKFPVMVEGPLMLSFHASGSRPVRIENGSFTAANPPTLRRLQLWKQARITVQGKADWLFVKLHCHSMDPSQRDAVVGESFREFLRSLVTGAEERGEILHFVSAREMVNIILAACDGREGNPGDYRDYRFKPWKQSRPYAGATASSATEPARADGRV